MTATLILHVAGLFVLVAASEMLNGIARTVFLTGESAWRRRSASLCSLRWSFVC